MTNVSFVNLTLHLQCILSGFFYRRARVTFDTSDTRKVFGPIVIDYHQVCMCILQLLSSSNFSVDSQIGISLKDIKICFKITCLIAYPDVENSYSLCQTFFPALI